MTTMTTVHARTEEAPTNEHMYLRTHRIGGDVLRVLLAFEESRLQELAASSPGGRAGKTLVKEGSLRVTQLALLKAEGVTRAVISSEARTPSPAVVRSW